MGEPSDDDVPTKTSSADLRPASPEEESGPTLDSTNADDRTIPRPPSPKTSIVDLADPEETEDSVTTMAPRARVPKLPLHPPGLVEIRTLDEGNDDDDDEDAAETEVRTLAGGVGVLVKEAQAQLPDEPIPDSVPRHPTRAKDQDGVIHISSKSLMQAAGDCPYDDDSVTTLGPAVARDGDEDSVTARAPSAPVPRWSDPGATPLREDRPSLADEDSPSITARAPGHLTNMLRVIATDDAGDDSLQGHTQVMAEAPLKPSDLGRLEPSSESGMRSARDKATRPPAFPPLVLSEPEPEPDRKPPYAILVGVVAILSIAIPILLFVVLRRSGGETAPRVVAQPSPDPITRGDAPRARSTKLVPFGSVRRPRPPRR